MFAQVFDAVFGAGLALFLLSIMFGVLAILGRTAWVYSGFFIKGLFPVEEKPKLPEKT